MIVLKVITLLITLVMSVLFFGYVLFDTLRDKRIKKLKELNKHLIELNKQYVNDYISLYDNMRELKKENEELKKTS